MAKIDARKRPRTGFNEGCGSTVVTVKPQPLFFNRGEEDVLG